MRHFTTDGVEEQFSTNKLNSSDSDGSYLALNHQYSAFITIHYSLLGIDIDILNSNKAGFQDFLVLTP